MASVYMYLTSFAIMKNFLMIGLIFFFFFFFFFFKFLISQIVVFRLSLENNIIANDKSIVVMAKARTLIESRLYKLVCIQHSKILLKCRQNNKM